MEPSDGPGRSTHSSDGIEVCMQVLVEEDRQILPARTDATGDDGAAVSGYIDGQEGFKRREHYYTTSIDFLEGCKGEEQLERLI